MVETHTVKFKTRGSGAIVDLTLEMKEAVANSGIDSGTITAFVPGATGGITTLEYEPGLIQDLPELMERLVPSDRGYAHDKTWQDGNGFSHLRAALIGPSVTVPFTRKHLLLGHWQQVVFLEFDNRPHDREIILQILGDGA
ncbi:MAG: secondary thiamine-phosphate synthase enzyme YjbQ [Candidatus Zixiibacteriota bacterium]